MSSAERVLTLEGTARERGETHGESLREEIASAVAFHHELIAKKAPNSTSEFINRFFSETGFLTTAKSWCPDLLEEVRGIATASNQRYEDIALLNLMDEFWWYEPKSPSGGCSVLGYPRTPSTPGILAQNMDLPAWMSGLQAVFRLKSETEDALIVSSAGLVGLMGVNRSGVTVCVNTLFAMPRSTSGLPVAFVFRELLKSRSLAEGVGFLGTVPHASGQHYAIGSPDGLIGVECGAGYFAGVPFTHTQLSHTNHPIWSSEEVCSPAEHTGFAGPRLAYSESRLRALETSPPAPTSPGVEQILSNTQNGLCMIPSEAVPSETFASMSCTLEREPLVRVAVGRPDRSAWRTLPWV